jgi:hypothetical protein
MENTKKSWSYMMKTNKYDITPSNTKMRIAYLTPFEGGINSTKRDCGT